MAIRLGVQTLEEAGLSGLTVSEQRAILARVYEVLELRVGRRLSAGANDRELRDFDNVIAYGTEREVQEKFESIVPWDYRTIVEDELSQIIQEVGRAVRTDYTPDGNAL